MILFNFLSWKVKWYFLFYFCVCSVYLYVYLFICIYVLEWVVLIRCELLLVVWGWVVLGMCCFDCFLCLNVVWGNVRLGSNNKYFIWNCYVGMGLVFIDFMIVNL